MCAAQKIMHTQRRDFAHKRDSVDEGNARRRKPVANLKFRTEHEEFLFLDAQTSFIEGSLRFGECQSRLPDRSDVRERALGCHVWSVSTAGQCVEKHIR